MEMTATADKLVAGQHPDSRLIKTRAEGLSRELKGLQQKAKARRDRLVMAIQVHEYRRKSGEFLAWVRLQRYPGERAVKMLAAQEQVLAAWVELQEKAKERLLFSLPPTTIPSREWSETFLPGLQASGGVSLLRRRFPMLPLLKC